MVSRASGSSAISGASWACRNRAENIHSDIAPPSRASWAKMLVGETSIHMAVRCGGLVSEATVWTRPPCELPVMPTRPLDQGWAATHSTVSYPSSPSCTLAVWKYWPTPSDLRRPLTSWIATTYPLGAK